MKFFVFFLQFWKLQLHGCCIKLFSIFFLKNLQDFFQILRFLKFSFFFFSYSLSINIRNENLCEDFLSKDQINCPLNLDPFLQVPYKEQKNFSNNSRNTGKFVDAVCFCFFPRAQTFLGVE